MAEDKQTGRRRIALGLFVFMFGFLVGDAVWKDEDLVVWARVVLVIIAAVAGLYWLGTTKLVRPHIPSLSIESVNRTLSFTYHPRKRGPAAQLKEETLALVAELHQHIAKNSSLLGVLVDTRATREAMDKAETEEEKSRIWNEHGTQMISKNDEERRENHRLFAGRVEYLLREYERRKLSPPEQHELFIWQLGSWFFMGDVARHLEALARKL